MRVPVPGGGEKTGPSQGEPWGVSARGEERGSCLHKGGWGGVFWGGLEEGSAEPTPHQLFRGRFRGFEKRVRSFSC